MNTPFDLSYVSSIGGLLLLQLFAIATVMLTFTGMLVFFSAGQSAAFRHRVWTLSMMALLALPLCVMVLPNLGPRWTDFSRGVDVREDNIAVGRFMSSQQGSETLGEHAIEGIDAPVMSSEYSTRINNLERSAVLPESLHSGSRASRLNESAIFDRTAMGLMSVLTYLWLLGVTGTLLLLAHSWLDAYRIVRGAIPVTNGSELAVMAEQLRRSHNVRFAAPLYCSPEVCVPLVVGFLRPAILVPTGYGQWTADRCRAVLTHEMAHINRQDVLCQLIARIACCLYWCHPLAWMANYKIRIEREFACDDAVLEQGTHPEQYAYHLLEMASLIGNKAKAIPNAIAMATLNDLEGRVRAILNPSLERSAVTRSKGSTLAAAMLTAVVFLCLMSPSTGQRASASQQTRDPSTSPVSAGSQVTNVTNNQRHERQPDAAPQQAGADINPLLIPVVGKGFIIIPFSTELQRASNGGHEKAVLFMVINGNAVINDDDTILDTSQLDLDGIEDAMVSYHEAGMDFKGKHVVIKILGVPQRRGGEHHHRLNASALLLLYFVNSGWTKDPQNVSMNYRSDDEPFDWDDLVAELAVPPTADEIHRETGVGDDLVRVHSIHTPLSRYLFKIQGENVVVRNLKPFADLTAEEIEILPVRAKGFIDQLDLSEPLLTRFITNFGFPISKGNRASAKLRKGIEAHGLATQSITLWLDGASRKTPSLKISVLGIDDTPIEDAKITVEYPPEVLEYHHGLSPVLFERRDDGRWHSSGLTGDEEFILTIQAPGYATETQTLSRPYNTSHEIEVKLREQ